MSFHSPWILWLIPIFLVLAIIARRQQSKQKSSFKISSVQILKTSSSGTRAYLKSLPFWFKVICVVLILIGLARPQSADTKVKKNVDGIDIMIALDISDSMLIEDMKPFNRMEAAKETIKKFVQGRTSDRIGIVIFAGESFTLVPLTLDYDLLLSRISEITTAQQARIKDGTAIGVALANASGKLKESTAKSRVMIFMTDGENNSGTIDPVTALEIAKGYGLKIYSIGIGRDGPTKIPIYQKDVFGNKVKTYQPFESTVNDDLLGKMASDTGGKYFRASREDSLTGVFQDIDRLEKTKVEINKFTRYTELYQKIIAAALFIYLISWALSISVLRRAP